MTGLAFVHPNNVDKIASDPALIYELLKENMNLTSGKRYVTSPATAT